MTAKAKYQVLVLEDEASLAQAIDIKLKAHGIEPITVADGNQGIELVKQKLSEFDGIWLDFDILGMNGVTFMEQFIKIDGWEKCPVLIVSNTGNPDLIEQAVKLGAKKWVIKAESRIEDIVNEFQALLDTTHQNT